MKRTLSVSLLVAVAFLGGLADRADAGARRSRPVRTGQTTCWDVSGNVIPCASTGQDGDLRRGEPRAYRDNGDGTIRDQRTALTWEKQCDDDSIHDKDNLYEWAEAFDKVAALNTEPCFAGFCDWRLPNRFELETLVDLGAVGPAVSAPFRTPCTGGCTVTTCSCTGSDYYWSSSTYAVVTQEAWYVDLGNGDSGALNKGGLAYVRAVRSGS